MEGLSSGVFVFGGAAEISHFSEKSAVFFGRCWSFSKISAMKFGQKSIVFLFRSRVKEVHSSAAPVLENLSTYEIISHPQVWGK